MKIGIASTDLGLVEDPDEEGTLMTFPGGGFWYRVSQPLTYAGLKDSTVVGRLTHNGRRIGLESLDPRSATRFGVTSFETGETHWDCDVIILQRCMWAGLPEAIKGARANGQVVINDVDDWFGGLPTANQAFKNTSKANNASINREIYHQVLAAGSALICSTPFLVEKYGRINKHTHLWRNSVDFESYPVQHVHEDKMTPGWLGNLGYRARDVEQLSGVLGPFLDQHDTQFVHMGHIEMGSPFAERTGVAPERMILKPPCSFITLSIEMPQAGFDVGLVPLEVIPFNHAKSCLKGMEYMAAGIPFIASPSEEYEWLAKQGVGRIAKRPTDWKRHLTELLDPDVRRAEVAAATEILKGILDIHDTNAAWVDIIKNTVA